MVTETARYSSSPDVVVSESSGSSVAIVAIIAILMIAAVFAIMYHNGTFSGWGRDVDVTINQPQGQEVVRENTIRETNTITQPSAQPVPSQAPASAPAPGTY